MAVEISAFYGITTTTLVVLSSATLAVFQFLSTAVTKKVESYNKKLSIIENGNGELNYSCDLIHSDAINVLKVSYEKLQGKYNKLKKPLELEIMLLFIVVLLAAFSIFLVLFSGV